MKLSYAIELLQHEMKTCGDRELKRGSESVAALVSCLAGEGRSTPTAPPQLATPKPFDLEQAMRRVEPGAWRGALVGFRELRRQFPHLNKSEFDGQVMAEAKHGRFSLHKHDFASSLTADEKADLVNDGLCHYVGCALRP